MKTTPPSHPDPAALASERDWLTEENARLAELVEEHRRLRGSKLVALLARALRSRPVRWLRDRLDRVGSSSVARGGEWSIATHAGLTASGDVDDTGATLESYLSQADRPIVAIGHPDWRGVRSSAENLFEFRLFIPSFNAASAAALARRLATCRCAHVVLQGLPPGYEHLLVALRRHAPETRTAVLWHGNFMQLGEREDWYGLRHVLAAVRHGYIDRVGFVKEGMADVFMRLGVPATFVLNYVRTTPIGPSTPMRDGPHLGVWANEPIWRKLPYTMLAGAALVPGSIVWSTGSDQRARAVSELLGLPHAQLAAGALSRDRMPDALGKMHVNLYVTLSECAPMLPLESLAVGAPCLIGPNSHYFRDHSFLHQCLVVDYPDNPRSIADKVALCLLERQSIISAYIGYAREYNERARQTLDAWLVP